MLLQKMMLISLGVLHLTMDMKEDLDVLIKGNILGQKK